ncbi:MAG TPA: hypothetical protein VJ957_09450, partial [Longimicrobiales bacterium]|nr:hypothetical protein [Longimicrobiales bacterium]
LAADGVTMESGTRYNVSGRVVTMSDSVLDAWQQSGAIQNEGERMQAEFATAFLEASTVTRSANQGGAASGGSGSGSGQGQAQQ